MKIIKMQPDLTKLFDLIDQRHGPDASAIKRFTDVYFESVTQFEFAEKKIEDVYGATIASWHFLQQRQKDEIKLKVFNPTNALDGWVSTHTVIQILTDDAPFIIDTVRMEINRRHMSVHTVHASTIQVARDASGQAQLNTLSKKPHGDIQPPEGVYEEAFVYLEIDKLSDKTILDDISDKLNSVLNELRCCVDDYPYFLHALEGAVTELQQLPCERPEEEVKEALAFLEWLKNEHFTFIAYDEFSLEEEEGFTYVVRDKSKNLGSFRFNQPPENKKKVVELSSEIQAFMLGDSMINFFKSGSRSRIHRPAYSDYVVVKRFNEAGEVIGGLRFMGLYTSNVYLESPKTFPIIR
ncbi:MAG: NAD-glutamate dehydrogenase, partial [Cellvibrionales bacterium]|nr:NAD-glutamate dehydrogenase [Cellvibrionales bacterium]